MKLASAPLVLIRNAPNIIASSLHCVRYSFFRKTNDKWIKPLTVVSTVLYLCSCCAQHPLTSTQLSIKSTVEWFNASGFHWTNARFCTAKLQHVLNETIDITCLGISILIHIGSSLQCVIWTSVFCILSSLCTLLSLQNSNASLTLISVQL